MLNNKRKEELIHICQDMVQRPSLSGKEKEVAKYVKNKMQELGFDEVKIDKYGSVIGHIKGEKNSKTILFDGHIDTVDVANKEDWSQDPFGAEIVDNKIYGRGTSDMKGAVSAMICAAAYFKKDNKFNGDIYVACPVHEECFEGVSSREISKETNPDYVVIGEASSLNLKRGQRGRAEIIVETIGKSSHSASPEVGKNAVYSMAKVINKIKNIKNKKHKVLGKGILELTDIISRPYPGASVVPDLCRVTYDRRTLVGETKESVLEQVKNELKSLKETNPELEYRVYCSEGEEECWTGEKISAERFFPAWLYDEKNEFIQKALKGLKNANLNPEISHYSFCTNGSHYAGERNIMTIGFGPSHEHLAHVVDEYIEIDQLTKACEGYYEIINETLK